MTETQPINLISKSHKEPSKALKTLRIYANMFGNKICSTDGLLVTSNEGGKFIYKQSSEIPPDGYYVADWIEDLYHNITINPIEIYNISLPYKIKIKHGATEYEVENHGKFEIRDIEEIYQEL